MSRAVFIGRRRHRHSGQVARGSQPISPPVRSTRLASSIVEHRAGLPKCILECRGVATLRGRLDVVENAGLGSHRTWYDNRDELLTTGLVGQTDMAGNNPLLGLAEDVPRIDALNIVV